MTYTKLGCTNPPKDIRPVCYKQSMQRHCDKEELRQSEDTFVRCFTLKYLYIPKWLCFVSLCLLLSMWLVPRLNAKLNRKQGRLVFYPHRIRKRVRINETWITHPRAILLTQKHHVVDDTCRFSRMADG